ncbi:AAA-like domain-containing protein [Pleurocapsa sp. PCC 7319]|uniref:AAA-like domain-containing protein n=1 Tax=Pleurocapsa sp. PCC 7319 TaxID=118161 RepID=UPI0003735961|nr:AAA-like domain-containing protein [Pleurocapsa sp. PCC 7319]
MSSFAEENEREEFTREEKVSFARELILKHTDEPLSDSKTAILRFSLPPQPQTYREMGDAIYLDEQTIREYGADLWNSLSEILERRVTKNTINEILNEAMKKPPEKDYRNQSPYLERIDQDRSNRTIESICDEEVLQPFALIKIKAPRFMGKTSLLSRIKSVAERECHVVSIDMRVMADHAVLNNLQTFLQTFCANVIHALNLEANIAKHWESSFLGANTLCNDFFEDYILEVIDKPLVLIFDEINHLFPYEEISIDFFSLLRAWHEQGKSNPLWSKIRLVLAYSTEPSINLPKNQSPFDNVGTFINLPEFTFEQVTDLANVYYSLSLEPTEIASVMDLVGGHPHLITLTFNALKKEITSLQKLLKQAPYTEGIYYEHLQSVHRQLREVTNLEDIYREIVNTEDWLEINTTEANDLYRLGLIKRQQGKVKISFELYRLYFRNTAWLMHLK